MLKELLIETSLGDMDNYIELGFPDTKKRQHIVNTVNLTGLKLIPFVGMKTLRATGTVSSKGKVYNPNIVFMRVVFEDENTDENITFKASDGEEYNMLPMKRDEVEIKVRCNCLDYFYRFAHYNNMDGSHQPPKAKKYVRKTDTYPPANPLKVPGVCKHILRLAEYLENTYLIED